MKRTLPAHRITSSALSDLHLNSFFKTKLKLLQNDYANLRESEILNSSYHEHTHDKLDSYHKHLLDIIEAEGLFDRLERFNSVMESSRLTFKSCLDYIIHLCHKEANLNLYLG